MAEVVSRPEGSKAKINSKNEFELCYLRHRYLRKTTINPTDAEMSPYYPIVDKFAKNTYFTYQGLFQIIGFNLNDVVSIGQVHIVNYLGLFSLEALPEKKKAFINSFETAKIESPKEEDFLNKNKANFTMFIKQRMEDLVRICRQKARNVKGTQVDNYHMYSGQKKPPKDITVLIDNHEQYGFKKIDLMSFRACKKRAKTTDLVFKHEGLWFVAVPLQQRSLSITDFSGADMDPYDNIHNMTPERIVMERDEELYWDNKRELFKKSSDKDKKKLIRKFLKKNGKNKIFAEEVKLARQLLKKLG